MEVVTRPIWKDYYFKLPETYINNSGFIQYRIKVNGEVIFTGNNYILNGQENLVEINTIARDYLSNSMSFDYEKIWIPDTNTYAEFEVYVSKNNFTNEELILTIGFWYDWSYQDYTGEASHYLSDPIINLVDKRQYFMFTSLFNDKVTVDIKNGADIQTSTSNGVLTYIRKFSDIHVKADFMDDFNNDFIKYTTLNAYDSYEINYNDWKKFTVKNTYNDYCLYYLNARGGWDWLLVEGIDTKNISYDRMTYKQNYDNSKVGQFGKVNYRNNITETYELKTGFMSDSQSKKMFNLFGSVKVYLHDLVDDKIIPVVITDTKQTVKTYRNNDRKMFNYTINVETSQNKIRM